MLKKRDWATNHQRKKNDCRQLRNTWLLNSKDGKDAKCKIALQLEMQPTHHSPGSVHCTAVHKPQGRAKE